MPGGYSKGYPFFIAIYLMPISYTYSFCPFLLLKTVFKRAISFI
jgi:hypothetical protein